MPQEFLYVSDGYGVRIDYDFESFEDAVMKLVYYIFIEEKIENDLIEATERK